MVGVSAQMSATVHDGVRRVCPSTTDGLRCPPMARSWRAWRGLAATAACAVVLTGCTDTLGGSGTAPPTAGTSSSVGSPDASTSPTTPQVEDGATTPGANLTLDRPAVVRFTANPKHDALIRLTVSKVERGKIKDLSQFRLSDKDRRSSVYYVSASVKNLGEGDLGGQPLSLYGKVSDDLVVSPVIFGSTFRRCAYQPLPPKFGPGKKVDMCIVMLAPHHGEVSAVQWRPADNSDPITWNAR